MTQDSGGSERPQRTVAELLAEYGGNTDGAPRRRRRRAEDDGDSAPQTIIERVLSDSGKLLPIREDQPEPPQRRAGGHRTGERRPAGPPAQQAPPAQAPQQAQPPAQAPSANAASVPTAYAEPVRPPSGGQNPPSRQLPRSPQQQPPQAREPREAPKQQYPTGRQPIPGDRPAGDRPPAQPKQPAQPPTATAARPVSPGQPQQPTTKQPAIQPQSMPKPGQQTGQQPQQPHQASRPSIPVINRTPPPGQPPTLRSPAARPPSGDEQETAVHPKVTDDFAAGPPPAGPPTGMQQPPIGMQPPVQARLSGMPPEATTEEFPPVADEPRQQAQPGRGGATQLVPPVGQPGGRRPAPPQPTVTAQPLESTQAHPGPFVDDEDGFPRTGQHPAVGGDDDVFPSREEYDDDLVEGDVSRIDSFDDVDQPASGREWLIMGAQVGVGAIAGAAVWLLFSWLWGLQPVVAVVAALAVIVGLVLGVRRWRRAEDMQTTVLAILAGLVVTVSPAALLLLHR